jgi:aryl-alcohol dehydrogenase-like predicted oxidoreductase
MDNTRTLGKTTIEVHPIGLGAMPLSLDDRPGVKQAESVIEAFVEKGGNFIDTANVYCHDETEIGHNEKLITRTLSKLNNKNEIIIASKGGVERKGDDWLANGQPEFLRSSCEQSLKDLNTDSIFLYQLHAPDPNIPLTDSVGELLKLKNEGKIQHIGLSNVNLEQIKLSLSITEIMSVQNRCSLFDKRSFTNGVIEFCEKNKITFIAHSPVGGHFQHKYLTNNNLLLELAETHNATPYQIVISWLLNKNPSILPIPGASKVKSIVDSLKSIEVKLSKDERQLMDNF